MFQKGWFVLSVVLMAVSFAWASPVVRVDLSQSGDVERGWIDWNTNDVRLGNQDISRQFLNEADFDDDFTIDFIKIDSRNRDDVDESIPLHDLLEDALKEGDPFDMVIKGLSPGTYTLTTYHHDPSEDVVNDDGTLNITVVDADGTRLVADHLQQSWGPKPSFVGVATFKFRSDGTNDVVITFGDNDDGIHNEAFLNGFELAVWVARDQATDPSPENAAEDVSEHVVLSWAPGLYAPAVNGHRVYLGETYADVNDGVASTLQGVTSLPEYAPAGLEYGTTYFWRVDEANTVSGWYKGQVWSFTTEPLAYTMPASAITVSASSYENETMAPQNTVNGSGLDADDLHSADESDMWLSGTDDASPWIQYEFDRTYNLHEMWVWNFNQTFESIVGFGLKDVTIQYSADGLDWTAVEGVTELPAAIGVAGAAHDIAIDLGGAVARYVRIAAASNWGGWNRYGLSEVRFFYIPMAARDPQPADGEGNIIAAPVLSWRPGRTAVSHDIYFGTDEAAVRAATMPDATGADPSFEPGALALSTTYFWRVDEVNNDETPAVWEGAIWSFTTNDFVTVDDMEGYTDDYEAGQAIWQAWSDGLEDAQNGGSQVGYAIGPFAERVTVHSGYQSMPLAYDNTSASYSQAKRPFDTAQDWTQSGIKTLVLFFHGSEANGGGQLYVKVNGAEATYDGDAGDIAKADWTQWSIDLGSLGANLQSVTGITIGVKGGTSGTIFVDDIQLWP